MDYDKELRVLAATFEYDVAVWNMRLAMMQRFSGDKEWLQVQKKYRALCLCIDARIGGPDGPPVIEHELVKSASASGG